MSSAPLQIHATWWAPDGIRRFSESHHTGTLSYSEEEGPTLVVYHQPSSGVIFRSYERYSVIWGESSDGHIITLFNVVLIRQTDFNKSEYVVDFALLESHVQSLEEPVFDLCVTGFPFLRNWALDPKLSQKSSQQRESFVLDMSKGKPLFSAFMDNDITTYCWGQISYTITGYTLNVEQRTHYNIECKKPCSIQRYLSLISEFSEFLSIALFCPQHPIEIKFKKIGENDYYPLLFKIKTSTKPMHVSLIKYDLFKEKIPDLIQAWHTNHERIAPIASYLIRSMRLESPFDTPDFLIIAQALDGYFKRFKNKTDGNDTRKYKDGIDKLLGLFHDIDAIQKCHIDSELVTDSRDAYSHLYPEEERTNKKVAVGVDLYWLTQKCKILLTCCILNMLGLDNEDINACCNESPISYIINSFPLE